MTAGVSIVIPMLNEAANLRPLLEALENQTYKPYQVIFVDAGSTDGSPTIITDWRKNHASGSGIYRIISRHGAFPGAARNLGIKESSSEWIAFLDCGIVPDKEWLAALIACRDKTSGGVFGVCRFVPKGGWIPQALCVLSYGGGKLWRVLPASIVHRSTFDLIGNFREDLRSAEDIEWFNRFKKQYSQRKRCDEARVTYSNFPGTLREAVLKWFVYARNTVRAGVLWRQQVAISLAWIMVFTSIFINLSVTLIILITYSAFRGFLIPVLRGGSPWILASRKNIFLTPFLGLVLDFVKFCGFLIEYLSRLKRVGTKR